MKEPEMLPFNTMAHKFWVYSLTQKRKLFVMIVYSFFVFKVLVQVHDLMGFFYKYSYGIAKGFI